MELVICDFSSLWQAIHASANLNVHMAVVDKGMEGIVSHDIQRNYGDGDAHVRIIGWWHGGTQVKIFEVTHHALGTQGGYDTVEEEFGSDDIGCFGANITGIFDAIAADSPTDVMGTNFLGRCAQTMRR